MSILKISIDGKDYIAVPAEDYRKAFAGDDFLPLPPADANGTRDAIETGAVSLVNQLIAWRKAASLDQRALSKLAGIPRETVNRMEAGVYKPRKKTLLALSSALDKVLPWDEFKKTPEAAMVP